MLSRWGSQAVKKIWFIGRTYEDRLVHISLQKYNAKRGGGRPAGGARPLKDPSKVFQFNNWDNVVWDEEQEQMARQKVKEQELNLASEQDREKYEKYADSFWCDFYMQHQNKFFKDRHWLFTEFPELLLEGSTGRPFKSDAEGNTMLTTQTSNYEVPEDVSDNPKQKTEENCDHVQNADSDKKIDISSLHLSKSEVSPDRNLFLPKSGQMHAEMCAEQSLDGSADSELFIGERSTFRILEIGCGAGNTVFPVLQTNNQPGLMVYCCDFASSAIKLVKEHPDYNPGRCHAFVYDVTDDNSELPFPENSLDIAIMIFVLSAIHPDKMLSVIMRLSRFLKPGGLFLFRDYGRYDMAQLRFKAGRCLDENFYARGDGTRVYFFTQEELKEMFTKAGLVEEQNLIDRRLQVNRGRQLKMYRVWLQCKYRKPGNIVL